MVYSTIPPLGLVSSQMSNHVDYCCKLCLHAYSTEEFLDLKLEAAVKRKEPSFPKIRDVDLPTSRNSYQYLL